jgi:hypothetical protein
MSGIWVSDGDDPFRPSRGLPESLRPGYRLPPAVPPNGITAMPSGLGVLTRPDGGCGRGDEPGLVVRRPILLRPEQDAQPNAGQDPQRCVVAVPGGAVGVIVGPRPSAPSPRGLGELVQDLPQRFVTRPASRDPVPLAHPNPPSTPGVHPRRGMPGAVRVGGPVAWITRVPGGRAPSVDQPSQRLRRKTFRKVTLSEAIASRGGAGLFRNGKRCSTARMPKQGGRSRGDSPCRYPWVPRFNSYPCRRRSL